MRQNHENATWQTAEQKVFAEILAQRLKSALGNKGARGREDRRWLASDQDYFGSVSFVCDALNIDLGYLRRLYRTKRRKLIAA